MAKVVYFTLLNNTKLYVNKVADEFEVIEISEANPDEEVGEPFIFVVPSYEYTDTNMQFYDLIEDFLESGDNLEHCKGLIANGNINFNKLYGITAKLTSEKYDLPILHFMEFQGSDTDEELLRETLRGMSK